MAEKRSTSPVEVREIKRVKTESDRSVIASPIHLTRIRDLPDEENRDAISLNDIIYHDDLRIMFQLNFTIDVHFVMNHVHPDARPQLRTYFVCGDTYSHKTSEILQQQAKSCEYLENITVSGELLINQYATHHSKIMVLFFAEGLNETAQVVIHTANMISFDWGNMTQGVWRSPRLHKGPSDSRFGRDIIRYFRKYKNNSCKLLADRLEQFDFSPVQATLVASAPGNYQPEHPEYYQWGVRRLQRELSKLPTRSKPGYTVAQVSSIATLGVTDNYLTPIMGNALHGQELFSNKPCPVKLVFPTVEDVAESLNGYASGVAIHFKRQTEHQKRQLDYLRPMLHRWSALEAGRQRCAPHIKTYFKVEVQEEGGNKLGWFLLTSANLSKHAWGTVNKQKKNLYIQSWECGVLIHPAMYNKPVVLRPSFKTDITDDADINNNTICIRMPIDLPLKKYSSNDTIWSGNEIYNNRDWRGQKWPLQDDDEEDDNDNE
jgi:tyrosyl-DNA phosphodiesterase-1